MEIARLTHHCRRQWLRLVWEELNGGNSALLRMHSNYKNGPSRKVDQHLNPDDLLDAINEQLYAKDITTPTAYHSTETSQSKSQLPWTQKRSREKLAKEPDLADFDKAAYKRQMAMPHPGCIRGRYSELWSTKSRIPLASLQNGLSSSGTTNAPRVI